MGIGCIICTEDFISSENEDKSPMCIKTCGHVFHKSCLNIWLGKSSSCPICRSLVPMNTSVYVTKLHFQNLSLDNSNILGLLDETDKLRDELKQKDEIIAKKDKKIADMIKSFALLSDTFSAVKLDFKDSSESSGSSATSNADRVRAGIRLVPSRAIQGRAPLPSSTTTSAQALSDQQIRRARLAVASRATASLATRGRSASNGALRPT